jgi:crotonobetainyl-CoA:carnitine CoA-transferase CaiB-like acyl-CoA transferase
VRPLEGFRVVEVAEYGFVPSAGAVLADWGADVVKVERPGGDPLRAHARAGLVARTGDFDGMIEQFNRNKRSVVVDLKQPLGRAMLDRLVARADVFTTSFLPSTRDRLALQPEALFAVNPRLVYARGHGYGPRGPDADLGGFDAVSFWARGGVGHMLTPPDGPLVMQRPAQGDGPCGMFLAGGIAAALLRRERTGEPAIVDVSLLAGAVWTLAPDLVATSVAGREPSQTGVVRAALGPLIGPYRTADARWLLLNMLDAAAYWPHACRALDLDELTVHTPVNDAALRPRFAEAIAAQPLAFWEPRLRAEDCIFSRLANLTEVLDDPQVIEHEYLTPHPTHASARLAASPVQFDEALARVTRPAPRVGEHTADVLGELGVGDAELASLVATGAVVT